MGRGEGGSVNVTSHTVVKSPACHTGAIRHQAPYATLKLGISPTLHHRPPISTTITTAGQPPPDFCLFTSCLHALPSPQPPFKYPNSISQIKIKNQTSVTENQTYRSGGERVSTFIFGRSVPTARGTLGRMPGRRPCKRKRKGKKTCTCTVKLADSPPH